MNIYDIAEKSGVSIATVSRVLNRSPNVSDKTRLRVLSVIEEQGYTPNAFARGLGLRTLHMAAVLCTDVADPFYAQAVSLIEEGLRQREYGSLLICTGGELEGKKQALQQALEKQVDAILLIGSAFREHSDNSHLEQAAAQVPVIILNGWVKLKGVYCVLCNEREAMEQNVARLTRAGCRRILYVYDAMTYSGSEKLTGYRRGMQAAGLAPMELCTHEKSMESAYQAVEQSLAEGMVPDGVLVSEDLLAVGAQKALAARGLSLPLIGFNDSILARCATPALTSVDNMLPALCRTGLALLQGLLEGQEQPQKTVLSSRLVERDTFREQK